MVPQRVASRRRTRQLAANGPNQRTEGTRFGPLTILLRQFKSLLILDSHRGWCHLRRPGFLKTSFVPVADCFLLLVVGAIPMLILEIIKGVVTHGGKRQAV